MNVVLIHGYSAKADDLCQGLGKHLLAANSRKGAKGLPNLKLWYADYNSLDNQACLEDMAEGMHLELKQQGLLNGGPRSLSFVVHSTGGLVVRQWLKQYAWAGSLDLCRSIVFLAPANFGSPLAHKANSVLGRIAKGNRSAQDFLEVGERIVKSLELGSPKQWELAHFDLFDHKGTIYHPDGIHAYVITGTKPYGGLRSLINEEGTDGTIVVSGAGLNSRKYVLDFVHASSRELTADWLQTGALPSTPFATHGACDHGTVLDNADVISLVLDSLRRQTPAEYQAAHAAYDTFSTSFPTTEDVYQQFHVCMTDDRNMAVHDFHMQFNVWHRSHITVERKHGWYFAKKKVSQDEEERRRSDDLNEMLRSECHPHSDAPHHRRFLVNLSKLKKIVKKRRDDDYVVSINILAYSGDSEIGYNTSEFNDLMIYDPKDPGAISLFYPNTTTLIDIRVDRHSRLVTVRQ